MRGSMNGVRRRRAAVALAVAAGLASLLAACGGDGASRDRYADQPDKQEHGDASDPGNGDEKEAPTPTAPPTPVVFGDVKGKSLTYQVGEFGVLAKPMSAEWLGQFDDQPADPGSKFLVVYVAVTTELSDRGVPRFKLGSDLDLRFAPANSDCGQGSSVRINNVQNCVVSSKVTLAAKELLDPSWVSSEWRTAEYGGTDLQPGTSYVTAMAYPVADEYDVKDGFRLCARDSEYGGGEASDPCVPISNVPARS